MTFFQTTLPNGLQIVAEAMPQAHSVAFGFFVRAGSRDETPAINGVSHFLEHMVFKGTERYSAADVNRIFDDFGAQYNAATGEESTMYYSVVLPEYFPQTFPLQADILFPSLRTEDFDTEKQVILEEIGMYDDQPAYVAFDAAMQRHFAGHPLGQIVLGTKETVTALTSEQMRAYHAERYRAGNMVLAVCGRFDWDQVVAAAHACCGSWPGGATPRAAVAPSPVRSSQMIVRNHLQQQQLLLMCPAPSATDEARFAAELLTVVVGDDSNSRLYWEFVDPGLADSAEISYSEFEGAGAYLTFIGGEPEAAVNNLERVRALYADINQNGITAEELELARNKVASRIVLRSERPMGRLATLGNDWLIRQEYRSVADDLKKLESLTLQDLHDVLRRYPLTDTTLVGVGTLGELPA